MNAYITYIQNKNSNSLQSLNTSLLNKYILTEEEQQYIETISDKTTSTINTLELNAATKAGSELYTQPNLNKLYVRRDSESYKESDKLDLKNFLNKKLVGNDVIQFLEFV